MKTDREETLLALGQLLAFELLAKPMRHATRSPAAQAKLDAAYELIREALNLLKEEARH